MYKHILIATDGSELAGRALAHGLALAKELNAPVTVVTVTQPWSAPEMALFSAGKANLDPVRQFEDMAAASAKVIFSTPPHRRLRLLASPASSSIFRTSIPLRASSQSPSRKAATSSSWRLTAVARSNACCSEVR